MILRVLAVWVLFIPLGILNGVVREYFLTPSIGEQLALPISGVLLSCLILLTTYLLFPFLKTAVKYPWRVGITWVTLTGLFELGFGHFVMGKPWGVLLEAYNPKDGNLWVMVLFVILLSPWLVSKIRETT
jgi:hypothetical protein